MGRLWAYVPAWTLAEWAGEPSRSSARHLCLELPISVCSFDPSVKQGHKVYSLYVMVFFRGRENKKEAI